jgi:hypothetical protein
LSSDRENVEAKHERKRHTEKTNQIRHSAANGFVSLDEFSNLRSRPTHSLPNLLSLYSSDQSFLSLLVEQKRFRVKKQTRAAEFDAVKVSRSDRARPKTGQALNGGTDDCIGPVRRRQAAGSHRFLGL